MQRDRFPQTRSPHTFGRYCDVHEQHMDKYRSWGFVTKDDLKFKQLGNGLVQLVGTIYCQGNLRICVTKELVLEDGKARSVSYGYDAIRGGHGRIFGYHSPHPGHGEHHPFHHRHEGDDGEPEMVCDADQTSYPTLGNVIEELFEWYQENQSICDDDAVSTTQSRAS